uniref:Uncharacterized protein n=1 Tax=Plectus sambesii TaxID=2011161 RepID=A0A914V8W1_9BILA
MDGPPPSARSHFADFDGSSRPTTGRNDDDSRRQNHGGAGVSPEEYNILNRRVDRMEYSIGTVVGKIDSALDKLEALERVKMRHREEMKKLITESKTAASDAAARQLLEEGVNKEMHRFDADNVTQ